jgi:hypothetical protein
MGYAVFYWPKLSTPGVNPVREGSRPLFDRSLAQPGWRNGKGGEKFVFLPATL